MRSRMTRSAAAAVALVGALAVAGCSASAESPDDAAENFPDGTMTFVVPYGPGGSADPAGREYARLLGEELGTTVVVENLPGGDETIGVTDVVQADPDGMRVGLSSPAGTIVQPLVNPSLPFQSVEDYTPVAKMLEAPNAIYVAADSPYETLDDLLEAAGTEPGAVSIGATGRLTSPAFGLVALEEQADVTFNIVPFSGGAGEAALATIGGQIDAFASTVPGQLGLVEAGDIRVIGHTGTAEYNETVGGAESFTEAGYDVPFSADYILIAAPELPDGIRKKLVDAADAVSSSEEWKSWCEERGYVATPMRDDELVDWIENMTVLSEDAIEATDARDQQG